MKNPDPVILGREVEELKCNRRLFERLADVDDRAALYGELAGRGFPALRFKSVLRTGGNRAWPSEDVYLLTARQDIERALQAGSVKPYAGLDSGGKFMLGMDDPVPHAAQRASAVAALKLDPADIERYVREALQRAMVLPLRKQEFDLAKDVAQQAALRLMSLVFGLPAKAHVRLEKAMYATYRRLTFQIVGRHFVGDDGLPPADSADAKTLKEELEEHVWRAAEGEDFPEWWDDGVVKRQSACVELGRKHGPRDETTKVITLGLIAGTIGNITSAVANTIDHFFRTPDGKDGFLIDQATRAARRGDLATLYAMVDAALLRRPPAPFLTRTARAGMTATGEDGAILAIPEGALLLLAMGADPATDLDLLFGGPEGQPAFMHSCVGRHLAWPLIYETVRQVLALPGLARVMDEATDAPKPLEQRWGAVCDRFPLRYQRDRKMNQQPLFLVLPIADPVAKNARKLEEVIRAGAPVVERALADAKNVHFAWFGLVENRTHLAMYTVYDGDFDAYVEHFALKVPLFDEQFRYIKDPPPTPVRLYPKQFVDMIRRHNRDPLASYFYSAYPRLGVAEIHNLGLDRP